MSAPKIHTGLAILAAMAEAMQQLPASAQHIVAAPQLFDRNRRPTLNRKQRRALEAQRRKV